MVALDDDGFPVDAEEDGAFQAREASQDVMRQSAVDEALEAAIDDLLSMDAIMDDIDAEGLDAIVGHNNQLFD